MIEVSVALDERTYPVVVGRGARHRLAEILPAGVSQAAIVTQPNVNVRVDPGVPSRTLMIDEGETAKTLETVEELCRVFAQMGMTRNDCVVAVGGGLVTDVGGFAAAVYHRGIAVVHVATTLLAQVDAAIGGKTGVNLPEGKNLVGAFWQPRAVLCDTEVIEQLPPREYASGTGEMAKYHFIGKRFGVDTSELRDLPLDERIARCIELKARVVALDEREGGLRAILNYGHTLAHALEIAGRFDLRHGEAVAIGIHYAALLARHLGRVDDVRVADHLEVLDFYRLPKTLPPDADTDALIALMHRDKEAVDGLTFVLDGPDGPEVVNGISVTDVRTALEEMLS